MRTSLRPVTRIRIASSGSVWPRAIALLCLPIALAFGCASDARKPQTLQSDHPLVGRIWDARTAGFIDEERLIDEAIAADFVLLGEVHVNPDHHAKQAKVIRRLIAAGRDPAVVFEMFDRDQQGKIDSVLSSRDPEPVRVARITELGQRGWDWSLYGELIGLVIEAGLPLLAGNVPTATMRAVFGDGLDAIPRGERRALGLDAPFPDAVRDALEAVLIEGHCGRVPDDMIDRLVDAQRLRDATLADVMLSVEDRPAVLIAGAGHARRDYGVARHLGARSPGARQLVVRLVEVDDESAEPLDYLDAVPGLPEAVDVLWFTPWLEREDPCDRYREGLEKLGMLRDS